MGPYIFIKQPWNKLTAPAVCVSERQDLPIQNRRGSVVNCYIHVRCNIIITRQSEMANTSPRHMPVLGNVHPIKIENVDIFS